MRADFSLLAAPGASMTGEQRVGLARAARTGKVTTPLESFARHLYTDPGGVIGEEVRAVADGGGDPPVVETIGIVSRLAAVDRFHRVLGVGQEPLPEPEPGRPTGEITPGLKRRRGHVPMPPGSIPVSLDLVPAEGRGMLDLHGPLYMTEEEMGDPSYRRDPGLKTPQLETVASRVSLVNQCFY